MTPREVIWTTLETAGMSVSRNEKGKEGEMGKILRVTSLLMLVLVMVKKFFLVM